ncbi:hypothetical protein CJ177_43950 [Rhodococcus sp. ACPA1]|nr:hypothetical protein CJ177_43950 [Rhodococcus sp. ACPA1]
MTKHRPRGQVYPSEMVRALVGVWLFAGCRTDEIRRRELDCVDQDEDRDDKTATAMPICGVVDSP